MDNNGYYDLLLQRDPLVLVRNHFKGCIVPKLSIEGLGERKEFFNWCRSIPNIERYIIPKPTYWIDVFSSHSKLPPSVTGTSTFDLLYGYYNNKTFLGDVKNKPMGGGSIFPGCLPYTMSARK